MTQIEVETYIELLQQPETDVIKVLSEDFGDQTRYHDARNPIVTTWLISFEHIRKNHPLATTFLSSMACLHEKSIPLSLFSKGLSKLDVVEAISVLTGYSFATKQTQSVDVSNTEELYDMHRLVWLAVQSWLRAEETFSKRTEICTVILEHIFSTQIFGYKDLRIKYHYLAHAHRLCEDTTGRDLPELYSLLEKMSLWLVFDGMYDEAVKKHTLVVKWREERLGISNEETLRAYKNLGLAFRWSGDLSRAESYLQQAFEEQRRLFGQDSVDSMGKLAWVLFSQGRSVQAEELMVQLEETSLRVLGVGRPGTLMSMHNLACSYMKQRRTDDAIRLMRSCAESDAKVLGIEHPKTRFTLETLQKWTNGEQGGSKLLEQCLELRSIRQMHDHPRENLFEKRLNSIWTVLAREPFSQNSLPSIFDPVVLEESVIGRQVMKG